MNNPERLFLAIGGAPPELVDRSGRRRRSRWGAYCLTAAACLALVLALGRVLPSRTDPVILPPDAQPPISTIPDPPEGQKPDPDGARLSLPEQGGEIGALRLLSYAPQSPSEAVDFLLYVNEEQFSISEDNGLYSIRNINPLPDGFPECGLDILHISDAAPAEAQKAAEETLKDRYANFSEGENTVLPDSPYLRADNGTEWDSEQAELWFVSDKQGGTFVLTARYFLEAEEGLGARFRDMASGFRVVSLEEVVSDWMRELYGAVDQLFPALFSNDLSGVSGLLSEGCEAEGYGEDVWADVTVASVDYTLDNDQAPAQATVSVKHRLNREEGDSFNYLTMHLLYQDGRWLLDWAGIEK